MRRPCAVPGKHWLTDRFRGQGLPALAIPLDGKPLLVGGCSKDRDARFGRAAGHVGRGYKLRAAWADRPLPEAWEVLPLNVHEIDPAKRLLEQMPGGYVLTDGNYDANALFDHAAACGTQLLAAQKDNNPGKGHRSQSPHRLRCIHLLGTPFGKDLMAVRVVIERAFGNATAFAGSLGGAPPFWVRRPWRVRLWVWAKLLINAARIRRKQGLAA